MCDNKLKCWCHESRGCRAEYCHRKQCNLLQTWSWLIQPLETPWIKLTSERFVLCTCSILWYHRWYEDIFIENLECTAVRLKEIDKSWYVACRITKAIPNAASAYHPGNNFGMRRIWKYLMQLGRKVFVTFFVLIELPSVFKIRWKVAVCVIDKFEGWVAHTEILSVHMLQR